LRVIYLNDSDENLFSRGGGQINNKIAHVCVIWVICILLVLPIQGSRE